MKLGLLALFVVLAGGLFLWLQGGPDRRSLPSAVDPSAAHGIEETVPETLREPDSVDSVEDPEIGRETLGQATVSEDTTPSRGFRARVLDPSGRPVQGAEIRVNAGRGMQAALLADLAFADGVTRLVTDLEGRCEGRLAPGDWDVPDAHFTIHFAEAGHLPGRVRTAIGRGMGLREVERLDVGEEWIEVEVVLEPGATIRGRVVDRAGVPLPGARVHARPPTGEGVHSSLDLSPVRVNTSPDGTFELVGLLMDKAYALQILAEGTDIVWAEEVQVAPGEVEVVVPEPCSLEVEVLGLPPSSEGQLSIGLVGARVIMDLVEGTPVVFPLLPSGPTGEFLLTLEGWSDRIHPDPVTLTPGKLRIQRQVELQDPSGSTVSSMVSTTVSHHVILHLVDNEGQRWLLKDLQDRGFEPTETMVEVTAKEDPSMSWLLQPSSYGQPGLPLEASARIATSSPLVARIVRPYEGTPVDVPADSSPLVLTLDLDHLGRRCHQVEFAGELHDGRVTQVLDILLASADGTRALRRVSMEGEELEVCLPAGSYNYRAREVGGRSSIGTLSVSDRRKVTLTFEETLVLHGTIVGAGSQTAVWLKSPHDLPTDSSGPTQPKVDGSYRMEAPGSGDYVLSVLTLTPEAVLVQYRAIHISEPSTRVDLDLGQGAEELASLRLEGDDDVAYLRITGELGPLFGGNWRGEELPPFRLPAGRYEIQTFPAVDTVASEVIDLAGVRMQSVLLEPGSETVVRFGP